MPRYLVSADVIIPILVQVEAFDEEAAEAKVNAMRWRDAIANGYGGDGAEIHIDGCQEDG